jgi:hypothetical protein
MLISGGLGFVFFAIRGSLIAVLFLLGASVAGLIALSRDVWSTAASVAQWLSIVVIVLCILLLLTTVLAASLPLTSLIAILGVVPASLTLLALRRLKAGNVAPET